MLRQAAKAHRRTMPSWLPRRQLHRVTFRCVSASRSVPLGYRMPNPPATFVGRRDELKAIKAATKRGPLVVLCGVGGLGKTSLAAATLHALFRDRVKRAITVRFRASQPARQRLVDLVSALEHLIVPAARSSQPSEAGATGLAASDEDLTMLAIDLAEAHGAFVVLDDVHHGMPDLVSLLTAIARHAQRSTWIATSRVEPVAAELVGQVIRLGPIGERHLTSLARLFNPSLSKSKAVELARDASGSPWKLRRLVSAPTEARDEPLDGVNAMGRRVLEALLVVERAMPEHTLGQTVHGSGSGTGLRDALDDLVRRGLVEAASGEGGYRLHDAARPWVEEWVSPSDLTRERAVAALAAAGEPEVLEALRLALSSGDTTSALQICRASFDALLHSGHAPTLWQLLGAEGATFGSFKLRAAMQLADVKITTTLDEPPPDALFERLLWARALAVEEHSERALRIAEPLIDLARKSGDARLTFWAALELAIIERVLIGPERGLDRIAEAVAIDDATRALRTALHAFWLAESGRIAESLEMLERSRPGAPRPPVRLTTPLADEILGGPIDFFIRYYRMAAFMECGTLDRAHVELTGGGDLGLSDSLRASHVQRVGIANLAIAHGRLAEARQMLDRLSHGASASSYLTIARLLEVDWRMASGHFAGATADLDALMNDTRARNALVHAWCFDARERLYIATANADDCAQGEASTPLGRVSEVVLSLRRALRAARNGQPHDVIEPLEIEGAIIRHNILATDALLLHKEAATQARSAIALAKAHGWAVREAESRQLLVECLVVQGDRESARKEAEVLLDHAASMPSPRFVAEARLLLAAVALPAVDCVVLAELASADDVAPCASRRARALLGDAPGRLDMLDERIVSAVRANVEIISLRANGRSPSRRWGLDVIRRIVWLPDGRVISLAKHELLMRTLETIGRCGGVATFAELATAAWKVRTFHPLDDGNRIRVAFHRLRALIEDDPARPQRVLLRPNESAYELGPEPFTLLIPLK